MNLKRLTTGWNVARIAKLALGFSVVMISMEPGMWIWLPVALYIILNALFAKDCGTDNCSIED